MGGILSIFTPSWAEGSKKRRVQLETECEREYESDESGIEVYRQRNIPSSPRYPRDGGGDRSLNRSLNSSFGSGNRSFSSRKERVPEPFTGTKGDLKEWLLHFETCSRWNDWSYDEKGVNLAMSLRGNAQQILGELSPHEVEDFDSIKAVLKRRFDPAEKETLRRIEFRNRMKKKDESVSEFGFALNRLASSAYRQMPAEARETIVIDHFVNGLPHRDLRRHVQFNHPRSIHEAIALASEFESFDCRFENRKPDEVAIRNIKFGESSSSANSDSNKIEEVLTALKTCES